MVKAGSKPRILVVDDDGDLRKLLRLRLTAAGYEVETVPSGEKALAALPVFQPGLVVTDLRMEGMDGMALFAAINHQQPSLPVIILTAHGSIPEAVEATQQGVFSYLTKPFDSSELLRTVGQALSVSPSQEREASSSRNDWRASIICQSQSMQALLAQADRVAKSDVSILIQSESGTGKELLARSIHRASPRRDGPFVAVNCSAIPEQLLESELFGHIKGAFTGATSHRKGPFQEAGGGTIFLDEIGDMPVSFQSKLLRTLQEGEVRPVGSDSPVAVDVRVISATHRELEASIRAGDFREDLYYRLNVVMLELPPLRDRREDIPLLVNHFLQQMEKSEGQARKTFSPQAMALLVGASWPGNIRQLQNVVAQTHVLSSTSVIPESLGKKALRTDGPTLQTLTEARDQFERDYLIKLLQMTEGNVTKAADLAGRNRTELYKLFSKHGLTAELFRRDDNEEE